MVHVTCSGENVVVSVTFSVEAGTVEKHEMMVKNGQFCKELKRGTAFDLVLLKLFPHIS